MQHRDTVDQQFGEQAKAYLHSRAHAQGEDLLALASLAATIAGGQGRVLDLGCGAGHASFAVAPNVAEVVAYDVSAGMLAVVEQAADERDLPQLRTRRGSVESLPFKDDSFDLVISRYSAHHWSDPLAALREARRVLRPDGRLRLIDVIGPAGPHAALLDSHLQAIELLRDRSHVRDYSVLEWLQMFDAAGFEAELGQPWRLPIQFDAWLARMRTPEPRQAAIRLLLAQAPAEVLEHYGFDEALDFQLEVAAFEAMPRG